MVCRKTHVKPIIIRSYRILKSPSLVLRYLLVCIAGIPRAEPIPIGTALPIGFMSVEDGVFRDGIRDADSSNHIQVAHFRGVDIESLMAMNCSSRLVRSFSHAFVDSRTHVLGSFRSGDNLARSLTALEYKLQEDYRNQSWLPDVKGSSWGLEQDEWSNVCRSFLILQSTLRTICPFFAVVSHSLS